MKVVTLLRYYKLIADLLKGSPALCVITIRKSPRVGSVIREVLQTAAEQGRLTSGVYRCAKLLEIAPRDVMMCILPSDCSDVGNHIHHTLMEAFCLEHRIKIIKIDNVDKLRRIVQKKYGGSCVTESLSDYSCILLQNPKKELSEEEQSLLDRHAELGFAAGSISTAVVMPV